MTPNGHGQCRIFIIPAFPLQLERPLCFLEKRLLHYVVPDLALTPPSWKKIKSKKDHKVVRVAHFNCCRQRIQDRVCSLPPSELGRCEVLLSTLLLATVLPVLSPLWGFKIFITAKFYKKYSGICIFSFYSLYCYWMVCRRKKRKTSELTWSSWKIYSTFCLYALYVSSVGNLQPSSLYLSAPCVGVKRRLIHLHVFVLIYLTFISFLFSCHLVALFNCIFLPTLLTWMLYTLFLLWIGILKKMHV